MCQLTTKALQMPEWTISELLDEAKRLQRELEPIYTWRDLRETIEGG